MEVGVTPTLGVGASAGSCGLAVEVGGIDLPAEIGVFTEGGSAGTVVAVDTTASVIVGATVGRRSAASSEQAMTDAQMNKHSKSAELEKGDLSVFNIDSHRRKALAGKLLDCARFCIMPGNKANTQCAGE